MLVLILPVILCTSEKDSRSPAAPVRRIVSLSPSVSREIVDLQAGRLLVGVTSWDDLRGTGVTIVGTLIQPNFEKILMLEPDLVLCSDEDGPVQNIERLIKAGASVKRFGRNRTYADICGNYEALAEMLGREEMARKNIRAYTERLNRAMHGTRRTGGGGRLPRVAFFLSCRPIIVASSDSFIGQIIRDSGGACAYQAGGRSYPIVSLESLVYADPDVIISMAGDADSGDFFRDLSGAFSGLKAVRHRAIFMIDPDTIPYYTPEDYVKSVDKISAILARTKPPGRTP